MRKMKPQHLVAISIGGLVLLFFIVSTLIGGGSKPEAKAKPATELPSVQVRQIVEQPRQYEVVLRGRTQATRAVVVRAEVPGMVAATPVLQGTAVAKGTVICRLEVNARQAAVDQARANLRSRQLQQKASEELARKGFRSPTQVLESQSNLDAANASVRQAEITLNQLNIRAPFSGVFDRRDAEIGTYLSPGDSCGTMIELNPLLLVGDVPETEAAKVQVGAPAKATLVSGQVIHGRVRYIAHDADPTTRTYRLEITVDNPGMTIRSGLSGEIRIGAGAGPAHQVPVSSLVLDSAGRQGVRYTTGDNRVAFAPVRVLDETADGVWVAGLQGPVRVVVVGQSYVADGQKVRVALAR